MTERLVAIPDVARLSARVVRVLGSNPGKFTLQGTNTYLVTRPVPSAKSAAGSSPLTLPSILIDTGEGVEAYAATLEKVLTGNHPDAGPHRFDITDIVLTHWHPDHVGGLPSVLSLLSRLRSESSGSSPPCCVVPPRLHKFPDAATDPKLLERLASLPEGSFTAYKGSNQPLHPLADKDRLSAGAPAGESSSSSSSTSLGIVHTPGHTADHVCLLLEEERALFTADHVLGQGTTVFEDLGAYMASLLKCTQLFEDEVGGAGASVAAKELEQAGADGLKPDWQEGPKGEENRLYPAHGPVLENGRATMRQYRAHRLEREEQILSLLAKPCPASDEDADGEGASSAGAGAKGSGDASSARASSEGWTIRSLVAELYSSYPEHLWPAAARGLFLALVKLASPDASVPKQLRSEMGKEGQRVACFDAEGGKVGDVKALMPKDERAWLAAMEYRWALLPPPAPSAAAAVGGDSQRL